MKSEAAYRASAKWRKNNKDKIRERDLIKRLQNLPEYMWRSAWERAKKKNIPFSIDISDVAIPEYCPILEIKLVNHLGEGKAMDDSPSLDRIIPSLGYIKGNIQVISHKANIMKANASKEELIIFAKYILEKYDA
jgi:hypothetical protein